MDEEMREEMRKEIKCNKEGMLSRSVLPE